MDGRQYAKMQLDIRVEDLINILDWKKDIVIYTLNKYEESLKDCTSNYIFQGTIAEFITNNEYKEKYKKYVVEFIGIGNIYFKVLIKPDKY